MKTFSLHPPIFSPVLPSPCLEVESPPHKEVWTESGKAERQVATGELDASGPPASVPPSTSSLLIRGSVPEEKSSVGAGLVLGSPLSISVVVVEFAKKGHLS